MAVYATITEKKVQYTDVDSNLSNCIGGGEDYRTLKHNTKDIYGGILAIRGWYGDNLSSCCMLKSISVHLEGVCENTDFKCDCDFTTMALTTNDDLSKNTKFTVDSYSEEGTFSKTFSSGSWQGVDNTVAVTKYNGGSVPANTVFPGVKLVFWNGNRLTTVKCKIRDVTISATRTRACWVIFEGDGITKTKTMYDYGTVPSYGSTPTRVGYDFVGWKSGGTTYTGALPAAGEQDVTYTAVWDMAFVFINYIGNGATSGEQARITQQRDISCSLETNWFKKEYAVQLHHNDGKDTVETLYSSVDSIKFLGWYTAAEDGERVGGSGDSYTPTENITLYAHWPEMPAVTLKTITRKGYTFLGWYTAAEGGTKVRDGGASYTPTENAVHLYAQWSSNAINQFRIGSKSPGFYLGQIPVLKIFKGTQEIYYNPFIEGCLMSLPCGTKIKYGAYNDSPIIWTIVDKRHEGYPKCSVTLQTYEPIGEMCFDSAEPNSSDSTIRFMGNSQYSISNIAQWLNKDSSAGNWYAPQSDTDEPPNYADKPGFLNSFSSQEKNAILSTTLIIPTAYTAYESVLAKVFLPSAAEIGLSSEGDKYHRLNQYTGDYDGFLTSTSWVCHNNHAHGFWTRTRNTQGSLICSDGVNTGIAAEVDYPVMPAMNLSGSLVMSSAPDSDGCYTVIF